MGKTSRSSSGPSFGLSLPISLALMNLFFYFGRSLIEEVAISPLSFVCSITNSHMTKLFPLYLFPLISLLKLWVSTQSSFPPDGVLTCPISSPIPPPFSPLLVRVTRSPSPIFYNLILRCSRSSVFFSVPPHRSSLFFGL